MGDNKVLRFQYLGTNVDIEVDSDMCNLLDLVIEFEDRVRSMEPPIDILNPTFQYAYNRKCWPLLDDGDLMSMFHKFLNDDIIDILVGSTKNPTCLNDLALGFRISNKSNQPPPPPPPPPANNQPPLPVAYKLTPRRNCNHDTLPSLDDIPLVDCEPFLGNDYTWLEFEQEYAERSAKQTTREYNKGRKEFEKSSKKIKKSKENKGQSSKVSKSKSNNQPPPVREGEKLPPSPVSPNTAFKSLPPRRSPRFSPIEITQDVYQVSEIDPNAKKLTDSSVFNRRIPRTSAIRKGIRKQLVNIVSEVQPTNVGSALQQPNIVSNQSESSRARSCVRRKMCFDSDGEKTDDSDEDFSASRVDEGSDSDGEVIPNGPVPTDELEGLKKVPKVKESWKPGKWYGFIGDDNDDDYFQHLYKNGEMYEENDFGRIELRPWMIFTNKLHLKDTVKDYAVQEGFAINVEAVDNNRYTVICYSEACGWRLHASRLPDGRTWAVKKIWPNVHTCRGLQTYNPICNVKWAANKVMEDIRANPNIPGKALNELLFQRFGVYMKQATLYRLKNYVINLKSSEVFYR